MLDVFSGLLQSGLFDQYVDVAENGINIDVEQEYNFDNKQNWYRILARPYDNGFVVTFSDLIILISLNLEF